MKRRATRLSTLALAALCSAGDWPGEGLRIADAFDGADPGRRVALVAQAGAAGGTEGAATILRALEDPTEAVVLAALDAVSRHRLRGLAAPTAARLGDERPAVRLAAVTTARALRDAVAMPGLVRAAGDSDAGVRAAAVAAIAAIGGGDAVGALLDRVHDVESVVRVAAVRALGDLGDRRAALSVLGVLDDPNPDVRVAAARALGRIPDPRAVRALRVALGDDAVAVRLAALRSLAAMEGAAAEAVEDIAPLALRLAPRVDHASVDVLARVAMEALCALDHPRATELLARVVREGRDEDVAWVTHTLSRGPRSRGERLRDALLPLPSPSLAQLELLGEVGGAPSADALLAALQRSSGDSTTSRVLVALGRSGDPRAPRALLRHATTGLGAEPGGRSARACAASPQHGAAIAGLGAYARRVGRLPAVALDPLAAVLHALPSSCVEAVRDTLSLLGATENPRAASLLTPWIRGEDPGLRVAGLDAGRRSGGLDAQELIALLADPDDAVRLAASDVLGRRASASDLDALVARASADGPIDRATTARALAIAAARLGRSERVTPTLIAWAERGFDGASGAALDALARLASVGDGVALRFLLRAPTGSTVDALGNVFHDATPGRRIALATEIPMHVAPEPGSVWSVRLRPDAEGALVLALESPRAAVATVAAAALAVRAREASALSDLATLCRTWRGSSDAAVRGNLGAALVHAGAPCARDVLDAGGRADEDPALRLAIASAAAARSDDPACASALRRCAMDDPSPGASQRCAALLHGGAPARGDLDLHLRDDDRDTSPGATVRITFSDGLVLRLAPDARGWIHLRGVATGPFTVSR